MKIESITQHSKHKIGLSFSANGYYTICLDCMVAVNEEMSK